MKIQRSTTFSKKWLINRTFFSTKNQLYNLHYICTIVPSICQLSFESFSSAILASENTYYYLFIYVKLVLPICQVKSLLKISRKRYIWNKHISSLYIFWAIDKSIPIKNLIYLYYVLVHLFVQKEIIFAFSL